MISLAVFLCLVSEVTFKLNEKQLYQTDSMKHLSNEINDDLTWCRKNKQCCC